MTTRSASSCRVVCADEARSRIVELVALLQDAVESGASIGFMETPSEEEAREYWDSVIEAMQSGSRILLAAMETDRIVGSVQLGLEQRPNGDHRCEMMKLFVLRSHRRRGLAEMLIKEALRAAAGNGRSLIVMDTRRGGDAERLCRRLGIVSYGAVPDYARSTNGELHETVFFYHRIQS